MTSQQFTISTTQFEGPLDLLLQLIEKRKLLINDISLAKVADDFMSYIKNHDTFPLSQVSHFVYVAATLVLIKSKSLLPNLDLSQEEEASIEDLEYRLKLYQLFKEQSKELAERFGKKMIHFKSTTRTVEPIFAPANDSTLNSHHISMQELLARLPKKDTKPTVAVKKVISLEETIDRLRTRVQRSLNMSFREFSGHGKTEKVEVIITFLAMLELVKQEVILVKQETHFDDIHMENQSINIPQYGG